jgi:cold shock CspA family protein
MQEKQGSLRENDVVEFGEGEGQNGKGPQAVDVRRI